MKINIFIYSLIGIYSLCSSSMLFADYLGWPVNITPAIEGRVVDATTGEPIENVMVTVLWHKDYMIGGPGGTSSGFADGARMLTDKDGKWNVWPHIHMHLLSKPGGVVIKTYHPLYEDKQEPVYIYTYYERDPKKRKWKYYGEYRNGKVSHDTKLLSYEEMFIVQTKGKGKEVLDEYLDRKFLISSFEDGYYFKFLKKHNKAFDLDEIIEKWKQIGTVLATTQARLNAIRKDITDVETNVRKVLTDNE